MNRIDKDKFIKVKKFSTAVKHLSKLVNNQNIFEISDVIYEYEEGLKKFYECWNNNKNKPEYDRKSLCELIEQVSENCKDENGYGYTRTITPWSYHYSFRYYDEEKKEDYFYRINICSNDEYWNYIDCGYSEVA